MDNIAEYVSTVFREFPKEITVIKNHRSEYSFSLLIKEVADILEVSQEAIQPVSLVVELVQFTIDIHSQIAMLPETDINNKMSILSGDLLFSHALEKILTITNPKIRHLILAKIAETTKADVLLGMMVASKRSFRLRRYEKIARLKSGSFPGLGFSIPSHYAKLNSKTNSLLTQIGISLGFIKQILQELLFFENQPLTRYNVQEWYFPFLILSRTDWKKHHWEKGNTFLPKDSDYLVQINVVVNQFYKRHQSLIKKLPKILKESIAQVCRLYLKELLPNKWLAHV